MGRRMRVGGMRAAMALVVGAGLLVGCDLLPDAPRFTVSTTLDGVDADPGDGFCEVTAGAGDCSLRAAIDEANASPEVAVVVVPSATYPLTISGVDDDNAAGDLDVVPAAGSVIVEPGSTQGFAIDASGADGGVDVRSGSLLGFGMGISGASGPGARVGSGAIGAFTFSSFHGNGGPGLRVEDGGRAQLWVSTVSGNAAGGVDNLGVTSARFVTVTANTGGGFVGRGDDDAAHALYLDSSLVTHQASGKDCADRPYSSTATTDSDISCTGGVVLPLNATEKGVVLEPLSDGLVPYHPLLYPGPVPDYPGPAATVRDSIPVGSGSCQPGTAYMVDQRLSPRPQSGACDRGAYEGPVAQSLTVDTAADGSDAAPGDGACTTATGGCSLRAAIDEANARPSDDTIVVADGIDPVLSRPGADEDANASGDLDVRDALTIIGGGTTIDAAGLDRVIDHRPGAGRLRIEGAVLVGGDVTGTARDGGAVWSNPQLDLVDVTIMGTRGIEVGAVLQTGTTSSGIGYPLPYPGPGLTMERVRVVDVVGSQAAIRANLVDFDQVAVTGTVGGAGIVANRGTVDQSTATDNDGGGLRTQPIGYPNPRLTVRTSTFAGNRAPAAGAGVRAGLGTRIMLESSTVSGNDAPSGSGLWVDSLSTVEVSYATIVDNGGTSTLGGPGQKLFASSVLGARTGTLCPTPATGLVTSRGTNVLADPSCAFAGAGDVVAADLRLGPLGDNGGPTPTHLPGTGSPVLDVTPRGAGCDGTGQFRTDQRGVPRPQGLGCDVGAVEAQPDQVGVFVVDTADDGLDDLPGDGSCWSAAAGGCSLRAAIEESNRSTAVETVAIAPGVDPVLSIAGRDEDANGSGDVDLTAPVVLAGGGATISAAGLDRVLDGRAVAGPLLIVGLTLADGDAGGQAGGGLAAAGYLRLGSVTIRDSVGAGAGGLDVLAVEDADPAIVPAERTELIDLTATGNQGGPAVRIRGGDTTVIGADLGGNHGGGLDVEGRNLTVRTSTIRGNDAPVGAGVRSVARKTTIEQSWVDGNHADGDGGGVHVTGYLKLYQSTVSDNEAGGTGGGVWTNGLRGLLQDSTISGNRAPGAAGGYWAEGAALHASTIVGNHGAVSVDALGATAGMMIVEAGSGVACASSIAFYGYDLFSDTTCGVRPTDRIGRPLYLGPLEDNGGPTPTHRPVLAGSPSVDAVPTSAPAGNFLVCDILSGSDQRGVERPSGLACDIGAVER